MSNLTKGLILLLVVLGIGAGLVVWKNKVGGQSATRFNSISRAEVEMLLADVAKVNPLALQRFSQDPSLKKQQLENLKQLLAFATAAEKEGLASEATNKQELENIRAEVAAVNYDKEINKDKGPMPPFGFITEDQLNAFWGTGTAAAPAGFVASLKDKVGLGKPDREAAFQKFLDTKVKLLKDGNPQMQDKQLSEDEKKQARDFYAKVKIYEDEFNQKAKSGELPKEFVDKVNLQIKLQQAQFLARLYAATLKDKMTVTDDEVAKYIAANPELDTSAKKAKAQQILDRAKSGEDFAKLANEFTEDPGNKGPKGELQGGLYKDVTKGKMVAPFETAALALQPGQVAPELVETDYGYHIIKLEGKGQGKDASGKPTETYDVRHILITTGFSDPETPGGRPLPVKVYAKQKLEDEKQKQIVDEIVASNNVTVPDDFTVPEVTEAQIQEMMKNRQSQVMGGPGGPGGVDPDGDTDEPTAPADGEKSGKPGSAAAKPQPPAKKAPTKKN